MKRTALAATGEQSSRGRLSHHKGERREDVDRQPGRVQKDPRRAEA